MKPKLKSRSVWSAILKAVAGVLMLVVSLLNGDVTLQELLISAVPIVWGAVDYVIRLDTYEPIK